MPDGFTEGGSGWLSASSVLGLVAVVLGGSAGLAVAVFDVVRSV